MKPRTQNQVTVLRSDQDRFVTKLESNGAKKLKNRKYLKQLRKLQAELCQLQDWVKHKGLRVIIIFEGRDAAGKGGTIKAITERVSPRVFRLVALPAPSDREKSQMYIQRYMQHFPAAGEIVIFDRSWYNRAGVEYVMGFCTREQHRDFLKICPEVEKYIVDAGIKLIKVWLEVAGRPLDRLHGFALAQQVVRVFARPGPDVRSNRYGMGTVACPAFG